MPATIRVLRPYRGAGPGSDGAYSSNGSEQRRTEHHSVSTTPETEKNSTRFRRYRQTERARHNARQDAGAARAGCAALDRAMGFEAERMMREGRATQEERARKEEYAADMDAVVNAYKTTLHNLVDDKRYERIK